METCLDINIRNFIIQVRNQNFGASLDIVERTKNRWIRNSGILCKHIVLPLRLRCFTLTHTNTNIADTAIKINLTNAGR